MEYQRNRERPNISWENDVEDWMGDSVWRLETNSRRSADVGLYNNIEDPSRQKRLEIEL